jgi:hypothetical protein
MIQACPELTGRDRQHTPGTALRQLCDEDATVPFQAGCCLIQDAFWLGNDEKKTAPIEVGLA